MAKTSHELAIEFAVEITELCSRIKATFALNLTLPSTTVLVNISKGENR